MPRNYVKVGPITREALKAHIRENYPNVAAIPLIDRAELSFTGMAATEIPGTRRALWVSAFITIPGMYMLEEDEVLR